MDWYPFIYPCADDESGHQVLLKRPIPRKVRACAQNFWDSSFRLKNPRQRSIQRVRRMGNERTRNTQKKSDVARGQAESSSQALFLEICFLPIDLFCFTKVLKLITQLKHRLIMPWFYLMYWEFFTVEPILVMIHLKIYFSSGGRTLNYIHTR